MDASVSIVAVEERALRLVECRLLAQSTVSTVSRPCFDERDWKSPEVSTLFDVHPTAGCKPALNEGSGVSRAIGVVVNCATVRVVSNSDETTTASTNRNEPTANATPTSNPIPAMTIFLDHPGEA